jgi:EmrB/QacA subfamily drug resistance transporter
MTTTTTKTMTAAQRWVLGIASVSSLMVVLDMLVVTTALNRIRLDLHASMAELEWTITAFTLSFAVLLLPAAALGDRLGRRRVFISGIILFTAASAACALAPGTGLLIAARAVQGVSAAMVMPHAMVLISVAFPPERRAKALGVFSSVTGLGTVGGPLVGGAITQGLDWHWIFWLNVPIGLVLAPLAKARVQESTGPARRLDAAGLALVAAAAFGLVWGLVRGNDVGWSSPETIGTLAAGGVLTIAFVRWELRTREPMLPMRFFRTGAFSGGDTAGFLMYAATVGATFLLTQYLQVAMHYGPFATGIRLLPWTVTLFVVGPITGSLVNRTGERLLIATGLTMLAAGFGWIALIAGPGLRYPSMIAPLALGSCGVSLAMPAAQNAVIGAVPPSSVGTAAGVFNTLRQVGSSFGVAIVSAVFAASGSYVSAKAFSDGFAPAVGTAAIMAFGGAVAGLWTPGRRRHEARPVEVSPTVATNAKTAVGTR